MAVNVAHLIEIIKCIQKIAGKVRLFAEGDDWVDWLKSGFKQAGWGDGGGDVFLFTNKWFNFDYLGG